jgi:hypothetical protein
MLGLSVDWGKASWNLHQLHVAADAGSLAGAQIVKYSPPAVTIQRAHNFAFANIADQLPVDPDTTLQSDPVSGLEEILLGRWVRQERKFYPTLLGMNAVKVISKRQQGLGARAPAVNLIFGHMAGVDSVDMAPFATSLLEESLGAGIICLASDPTWQHKPTGLWIHGTGTVNLSGYHWETGDPLVGDIQVNAVSTATNGHREALVVSGGSATINANEIKVVGVSEPAGDDGAGWSSFTDPVAGIPPSVLTDASHVNDPLAALVPPALGTPVIGTTIDDDYVVANGALAADGVYEVQLSPGYYPGGINLDSVLQTPLPDGTTTATTRVILQGGNGAQAVYSLGGDGGSTYTKSGLILQGGASVVETDPGGVMLYITGEPAPTTGPPVPYGSVELRGGGFIQISPRGDWMSPREVNGEPGVSIWQDRNNSNEAIILGNADFALSGTLYFSGNHVELGGSGFEAGNQLLCASLDLHGTGDLGIAYDGRNFDMSTEVVIVE